MIRYAFVAFFGSQLEICTTLRLTSFPVLLSISLYERQAKMAGTIGFYDTIAHVAEKVIDTLPRSLKRMSE